MAALIEGSLLLDPLRSSELQTEWSSRSRPALASASASACAKVLTALSLSATTSGSASTTDDVPESPAGCSSTASRAARAILDRICDQLESDPAVAGAVLLGRHVDLARLARRLEITERRLYSIWPTPESFNSVLAEAIAAGDQQLIQQVYGAALESAVAEARGLTTIDFIALSQTVIVEGHRERPAKLGIYALAACQDASTERLLRVVGGNQLDTPMILSFLALLGRRRHPEHSPREVVALVTNATAGLQRLLATDPALEHEVVPTPFGRAPTFGWSLTSVMLALSAPSDGA